MSDAGQTILAHPDIRKLLVRSSAYAGLPADYHSPRRCGTRGGYLVDADCSAPGAVGQVPILTVSLTMTYAGPRQRGRLLRHTITTQHQVGVCRFLFRLRLGGGPLAAQLVSFRVLR